MRCRAPSVDVRGDEACVILGRLVGHEHLQRLAQIRRITTKKGVDSEDRDASEAPVPAAELVGGSLVRMRSFRRW